MRVAHVEFVHNLLHMFALHVLTVNGENNLPSCQIGFQICRRSLSEQSNITTLPQLAPHTKFYRHASNGQAVHLFDRMDDGMRSSCRMVLGVQ